MTDIIRAKDPAAHCAAVCPDTGALEIDRAHYRLECLKLARALSEDGPGEPEGTAAVLTRAAAFASFVLGAPDTVRSIVQPSLPLANAFADVVYDAVRAALTPTAGEDQQIAPGLTDEGFAPRPAKDQTPRDRGA